MGNDKCAGVSASQADVTSYLFYYSPSQHLLRLTMFSHFTEGETEAQRGQRVSQGHIAGNQHSGMSTQIYPRHRVFPSEGGALTKGRKRDGKTQEKETQS